MKKGNRESRALEGNPFYRNTDEELVDRLLLLYSMVECKRRSAFLNKVKIQKILFLSEKEMIDRNIKGYNYNFFRFTQGPFSKELGADIDTLVRHKLLVNQRYTPTKKGETVLADFQEPLDNYPEILEIIVSIIDRYGRLSTDDIKKIVYNLEVQIPFSERVERIREIPISEDLLFRMIPQHADIAIMFDDDIYEDLYFVFNSQASERIQEGMEQLREGELLDHNDVFGD